MFKNIYIREKIKIVYTMKLTIFISLSFLKRLVLKKVICENGNRIKGNIIIIKYDTNTCIGFIAFKVPPWLLIKQIDNK